MTRKPASGVLSEFASVGGKAQEMLNSAIERWRTLDREVEGGTGRAGAVARKTKMNVAGGGRLGASPSCTPRASVPPSA